MRPLLRTRWSAAGDLGVSESQLAAVFEELGLGLTVQAFADRMPDPAAASEAITAALRVSVEGVPLGDWTAGYGAADAVAAALAHDGRTVEGTTVAIQGFGPVGATAALALRTSAPASSRWPTPKGCSSTGVDWTSTACSRPGRPRPARPRRPARGVRTAQRRRLASPRRGRVGAQAVAGAIDADSSERVQATMVVEAANLPTTAAPRRGYIRDGYGSSRHRRECRHDGLVHMAGHRRDPPEAAPTFDRLPRSCARPCR